MPRRFLQPGRRVCRWNWHTSLAIALTFLGGATATGAQITASAPDLTAAFILNFVKFVDWPADVLPVEAPLTMCVADPAVSEAVTRTLASRPPATRQVKVISVQPGAVPAECGVIYVSDLDDRRMATLVAALKGRSVLAISDAEDFAKRGGTIQLFQQDGSMKFSVNPQAAERARLHVSSQLLKLAVIVKE
jgi:hypothetical protein